MGGRGGWCIARTCGCRGGVEAEGGGGELVFRGGDPRSVNVGFGGGVSSRNFRQRQGNFRGGRGGGVVTVHDVIPLVCRGRGMLGRSRKARWSGLWRAWCRDQVRRAAAVITVSHASKADLVRELRVEPAKVVVVYNGVAPAVAGTPASDVLQGPAVNERGLQGQAYVLYVGRRDPYKNLVGLVREFGEVRERLGQSGPQIPSVGSEGGQASHLRAGLRLVVVGDRDPRYPEAEHEARRQDLEHAIDFVGHVSDAELARWTRGAATAVVPSFYEGFGLPAAEAMAAGVPVIASDVAGLAEVVGDAGLRFDPHVPGAMAAAMLRVLTEPTLAAELAARGRERAATFSLEAMARGHLAVYRAVMEQAQRPAD